MKWDSKQTRKVEFNQTEIATVKGTDSAKDVSQRQQEATMQRDLSATQQNTRVSSEMANIGFRISFKIKLDGKYPTTQPCT